MKIFSASAMGQHLFETNQRKGHLKKTTRSCPVLKLPRSWRKAFEELGWRAISWRWRAGTPTLQLLPSNTNTNATKIQKNATKIQTHNGNFLAMTCRNADIAVIALKYKYKCNKNTKIQTHNGNFLAMTYRNADIAVIAFKEIYSASLLFVQNATNATNDYSPCLFP